jgi:hypothetical protein
VRIIKAKDILEVEMDEMATKLKISSLGGQGFLSFTWNQTNKERRASLQSTVARAGRWDGGRWLQFEGKKLNQLTMAIMKHRSHQQT